MKKKLWLAVLLWTIAPAFIARGMVWDFEKDESSWRPRVGTVTIRRVPWMAATPQSGASLQIAGSASEGFNYALSNRIGLRENQWYRLEGWLRVDGISSNAPMPYLKCDFIPRESGMQLGIAVTNRYHNLRMGRWQKLSALFQAPAGTVAAIVALEKGTNDPTNIHAYLDDVSITAVSEAQIYEQYRLPELSKALAPVRGVHPRLFLTDKCFQDLRRSIQTTHVGLWPKIRALADDLAAVDPPQYNASPDNPGQLWQRPVGNALPYLAMAYRLTGERRYLDAVRKWALASCNYPTWGLGFRDSTDLAGGHQLFGLALVYDWCYHDLDRVTRDRIRHTLITRGTRMFQKAAKEQVWWHRLFMHNHLWVSTSGLAAAGLAVFDEADDALLWIGLTVDKFASTKEVLGSDGASHEGIGYWQYGAEYMLKFMHLAQDLLGIDFYDHPWWQNTARYPLYLSLPRSSWTRTNSIVDFADSPRRHWYGPDHTLRHLATVYRDGHAQWLADQIDRANIESSNAQWLNLIWYDPSVAIRHPRTLPTLHHFANKGIVSARTDWNGNEGLLAFKCGPFIGHTAITEMTHDPGGGHSHPDAGHFVLFGNGEWLIQDDGIGPKWTHQHNTLLIDGQGQLGEGGDGFDGREYLNTRARPRILTAISRPQYDHIAGDATPAYPGNLGLTRFVRHLIFVKPDVLLVLDDIRCASPKQMELRFHPAGAGGAVNGNRTAIVGDRAALQIDLLTPASVSTRMDRGPAKNNQAQNAPIILRYTRNGQEWRNAVALSWTDIQRPSRIVTLQTTGNTWRFVVDGKPLTFNWTTGGVTFGQ